MERRHMFRALALVALVLGTAGLLSADDDDEDEEEEHGHHALRALPVVTEPAWKTECGSCHVAYHPALLPERSWRRVMGSLDDHFGENAALAPPVRATIEEFLARNAADRSPSRRGQAVDRSVDPAETPLRVTGTRAWARWHHELAPSVFKGPRVKSAANCSACHPGAAQGDFNEHRARIPR